MLATHRLAGMGLLRDRMLLFLVMCLGASLCITGSPLAQPLPAQLDPVTRLSSHTGLPLQFIANQGQADSGVAFEARGASGTLMFSRQRISLALPMSEGDFPPKGTAVSGTSPSVLSIELLGADSTTEIVGTGLLPGVVNYVIGNDPSRWYLGIETHAGILYRSLYPGVDLAYYGSEGLLKGTYTVAPGADPAQIRWRYDGAANVNLNEAMGALQIAVATGTGAPEAVVTEYAPIAWQDIGSSRVNVPVRYQIEHGETISFVVGAYDQRYPLVIDPILEYSSYLGGNTGDTGYDIALDGDGNIYIAGGTTSANFPGASGSPGGWQMSWDVVVIKFSADGSTLLYTTIFGGGGQDDARGIAVDSAGSAHIVGWTGSPDLPVVNAIQPSYGGDDYDMFVAKLSPDGQHIVYSTFLGGNKYDLGNGIALDNQGNAYAIGTTSSWGLLIQAAFQPYPVGCQDVYLVKLTPVGAMAYGTYLGGPNCESGAAVAVDDLGNAYLVGTAAPQYPLMNPAQNCSPFSYDAFVTKLTPDGQALVYSTCLGGSGSEEGLGLALDSSHRAYVVGLTSSSDFPTVQAVQSTSHGSLDAFIARLSADGQAVEYSTYLGGTEQDRAHGVTVTGEGSAVLTGQTMSVDFPLADPLQNAHAGSDWDVFVTKLTADGTALEFSTYLGGAGPDVGLGIASDSAGSIYVTGLTDSYNFPVVDPFQSSNRGYSDIFLTILGDGNHPPTVSAGGPYTVDEGSSIVLVADGSDPEIGALTYTWDLDLDGVFESPGQSVTFSAVSLDGPDVRTVAVQVTDLGGLIATAQAQVVIPNVEPSASFVATPAAVPEGQSATLIFSDSLDPGLADTAAGYQYSYDCSGDGVLEVDDTTASSVACPYLDDGVYAAAGRIKDKDGGFTDYTASVVVSNVTPSVGPIAVPHDPVHLSTSVTAVSPFQDAGVLDTHTAVWDWGDGTTSVGTVSESHGLGQTSGSHVYLVPGVYTAGLTVLDDDGGAGQAIFEYVVVYESDGGFVTGGGWINSPAGACLLTPACQATAGRANFGFVAKYKKGASVPTGSTQFQFQAGAVNFHSTSYEWLVVAGSRATFKGNGTINGQGDYGLMLSAIDGQVNGGGGVDKFRVKIWNKSTGAVIYDNQMNDPETGDPTTILGGGSIVIHRGS